MDSWGFNVESVPSWTSIKLELEQQQRITEVAAGPKNSFIIVETNND